MPDDPDIDIEPESPGQPEIEALIAASDAYSLTRYPAEGHFGTDIAGLVDPDIVFLVARRAGEAVGCGAVKWAGDGTAEIKRMFVRDDARGFGIGRRLIGRLEALARARGIDRLNLETGPLNTEAVRLYRAVGFDDCGPFPPYRPNPWSLFLTKRLD
jgi:putative acetyltransferase